MISTIRMGFLFLSYHFHTCSILIWVRTRNCGCLVTWFCYRLIAKPGNKTAAVSWPDPYIFAILYWCKICRNICILNKPLSEPILFMLIWTLMWIYWWDSVRKMSLHWFTLELYLSCTNPSISEYPSIYGLNKGAILMPVLCVRAWE